MFDVGASFGIHTVTAASLVGPSGRVYAFEPAAATASALRDHLELNGVSDRTEVIEAVVDERSGTVEFWEQSTSMMASLAKDWTEGGSKLSGTDAGSRRSESSIRLQSALFIGGRLES